jgi:large repetitive protein
MGPWYVIVATDPVLSGLIGDVFEHDAEHNNDLASTVPVLIQLPPPTDLQVMEAVGPSVVRPGDVAEIRWTVRNMSNLTVTGTWSDAVYLSSDAVWDVGDRTVGQVSFTGTLQPGQTYSTLLRANMPAVATGTYRFLVRTDIFDQVYEGDGEANNTTAAADVTQVTVDTLQLGVAFPTSLTHGGERLFRVEVPAGQTLRVRMDAADDRAATVLYVRHDTAPTGAVYDATPETPLAASQTAVIPTTTLGIYYVLVRGHSVPGGQMDATVTAELLPLMITDVTADFGGDGRYVTTTIRGASFQAGATVKLVRPGFAEYVPVAMRVFDATTIRATFDLRDAPRGLYDVTVINPDGQTAIVPYRFLVQQTIEPDVTIGLGGPRVIMAGDTALYSVAIQSTSNLDTPYAFFQVGIPEMGVNDYVYGLPYVRLASNVRGGPEQGDLADLAWPDLNSAVNTNGYTLASGYLHDHVVDGFTGFSFSTITYPGMSELNDQAWEELKAKLYAAFPAHARAGTLDQGPAGLDDMHEGLLQIWQMGGVPDILTKPFVPFQFHVMAAATAMTRDEFVQHALVQAARLRDGILADPDAPAALLTLAADESHFGQLYLAALEESGLLRPEDDAPPVRQRPPIVSLMATLASGILAGPAGQELRSGNLTDFFDQLRQWYGHEEDLLAPVDPTAARFTSPTFELTPPVLQDTNPIPTLAAFEDFDLQLAARTRFQTMRVYVPWIAWAARSSLPPDYLITGIDLAEDTALASVDLSQYLAGMQHVTGSASLTGPYTAESAGFVPVGRDLPYSVRFQNDSASTTHAAEVRVAVEFDSSLDPRSFRLGSLQVGDLPVIQVPANQALFQADYDYSQSRGYILRVSAGMDSASGTASWLLQAIDPHTGTLIQDPQRGLLRPNNARGEGAGFIEFTIRAKEDLETGTPLTVSARVLMNNAPPEDAAPVTVLADGQPPTTELTSDQAEGACSIHWQASDPPGGSGLKHVTLYVSEDGGDFRILARELADASGTFAFAAQPGRQYEFLALATDRAGNRERPPLGVGGITDDLTSPKGPQDAIPPDLGPAPAPRPEPSSNPLFVQAEAGVPASGSSSEYSVVLEPLVASAFATGIPTSHAGIGPMAVVEAPDGTVLVSGGEGRNQLHRFPSEGGVAGDPLISLDEPVFNLAFDQNGRLWATTGGGPLLELHPGTGQILARHGDGITIALAVHPTSGMLYVTSHRGVERFDPATGTFTQFSRDRNLRFGSLAFAPDGTLWAVSWPDRLQVVRFTPRARAEVMLSFDAPADSIAFGREGTMLQDLLFVSHNAGVSGQGGSLTMVDLATLRRIEVARNGSRGDALTTTSDGRILVSQSQQVDVLRPQLAPMIIGTNPPDGADVALPFSLIAVTFDQDMVLGSPNDQASVLNPDNYQLLADDGQPATILRVVYDPANRTALVTVVGLTDGQYSLTVKSSVRNACIQVTATRASPWEPRARRTSTG